MELKRTCCEKSAFYQIKKSTIYIVICILFCNKHIQIDKLWRSIVQLVKIVQQNDFKSLKREI